MAVLCLLGMSWKDRLGDLRADPSSVLGRLGLAQDLSANLGLGVMLGWMVVVASAWLRHCSWARFLEGHLAGALEGLHLSQALLLALASGVAEELLFRGVIHAALVGSLGLPQGLVLGAVIFGLAHLGPDRRFLGWTAYAVVMGLCLGGLFHLTGSLQAPIALHVTVNGLSLLLYTWEQRMHSSDSHCLSGTHSMDTLVMLTLMPSRIPCPR